MIPEKTKSHPIEQTARSVVSLDPVVVSLRDGDLHVLLRRRPKESVAHPGQWALPGGVLLDSDLGLDQALRRVMATWHRDSEAFYMEQLHTRINHDPRGPTVSVAYLVLASRHDRDVDLTEATWHPVSKLSTLAFDHAVVVERALKRLRAKANYSILPAFLLPPPAFTIPDLQLAYESVLGARLDKSTFYGLVRGMDALEPTGGLERSGLSRRPAALYRLKNATAISADTLPTLPKNITR